MDGIPSNITCQKMPVFGLILISIFLINITALLYTSYNGHDKDNLYKLILHLGSLAYYIFILIITYFYSKPPSCNPSGSLLFHPVIFSAVVIYIIGIVVDSMSNLIVFLFRVPVVFPPSISIYIAGIVFIGHIMVFPFI